MCRINLTQNSDKWWAVANTAMKLFLPYNVEKSVTSLGFFFDILFTVHLSIFISVFNQLDAQNLFHNKFYFMPLHVPSTCAHHQEVKIALHNLWYHHTYTCDDTRGCVMQFRPPDDEHMLLETCRGLK